jgi:hypothetical protein
MNNRVLSEKFADYTFLEKLLFLKDILKEMKLNCNVPTEYEKKIINETTYMVNGWIESLNEHIDLEESSDDICFENINKEELIVMALFLNEELGRNLYHQFHVHKLVEYKLNSFL